MKGIVVTTDLDVSIQDFSVPLYKSVGETVGGYIEHVNPIGLNKNYCMIVNEEGRIHGLPINYYGSLLYGTPFHGEPIVGTIVIMKDGWVDGEPDIVGLDEDEIQTFYTEIKKVVSPYKTFRQMKGENHD